MGGKKHRPEKNKASIKKTQTTQARSTSIKNAKMMKCSVIDDPRVKCGNKAAKLLLCKSIRSDEG